MKQEWAFRSRFRAKAYGWKGSALACQRLKEAVAEIRKAEPALRADGAVALLERVWPAFQGVDSSSGALGGTVAWAQAELLPFVIAEDEGRAMRLERLREAIAEDGVDFLAPARERWGELCGTKEAASAWADRLAGEQDIRERLSCLLAAERDADLFAVLAAVRFPFWHYRQFGVRALLRAGKVDEALAYAEASRGRGGGEIGIDQECERILLAAGRAEEAFSRYALRAADGTTGLSTFRALSKKYPGIDKRVILERLAEIGDTGRWFAAAKDAGFLDLALRYAKTRRTDPATLGRAARDFLATDWEFAWETGRMAVERYLDGYGYQVVLRDVQATIEIFFTAADRLGRLEEARRDVLAWAEASRPKGNALAAIVRQLAR